MLAVTTIRTPWVPLTVIADDDCVVSSWFGEQSHHPVDLGEPIRKTRSVNGVSDAVAAWLDGDLSSLDQVKVRQTGGPFFEQLRRAGDACRSSSSISGRGNCLCNKLCRAVCAVSSSCARRGRHWRLRIRSCRERSSATTRRCYLIRPMRTAAEPM